MTTTNMTDFAPQHFLWEVHDRIATIRLNRPERKNPLTFESYAELLYTGRSMTAAEGERWGFFNSLHAAEDLDTQAQLLATRLAAGPTFAHGITKTQLNHEWSMGLEQAIEAEAQAQAICMQTADFERAYNAFVVRDKPVFEGN